MEGNEREENKAEIPEEWAEIPIQDYFDKGFKPTVKTVKGHRYIVLKKGRYEKSLGPYTDERWELIVSMYPKKLELPPIEERIKELKEKGLTKEEMAYILHAEGYPTKAMLEAHIPINVLKRGRPKGLTEEDVMSAVRGTVRGEGFLQEFKNMIRAQISRSRELTEFCTNLGLGVLFAALRRSGISIDDFRRISTSEGALRESLTRAAETAFKAIDYYDAEKIEELERERDEARVAYSMVAAQLKDMQRRLSPRATLEKIIYAYLMSGNVDANVLSSLIDKLLGLELKEVRAKVIGA